RSVLADQALAGPVPRPQADTPAPCPLLARGRGMRQALRASVAVVTSLALVTVPAVAEPTATAPAQAPLTIRIGQAQDFSRIEFRWAAGAQMGAHRDGQVLTLSFSRDAKPDLATLKSVPLKWIKSVDVRHDKGRIAFILTLTDDADAATGVADGADFVNVFARQK